MASYSPGLTISKALTSSAPSGQIRGGQQFLALGRHGLKHVAAFNLGHQHIRPSGEEGPPPTQWQKQVLQPEAQVMVTTVSASRRAL